MICFEEATRWSMPWHNMLLSIGHGDGETLVIWFIFRGFQEGV